MKRRGRPPYPDILTPREWEVLDLLRAGLTNEKIAQQLGISLQGAKFHVSEILGKLQLPDRRAAARWEAPRRSPIAPAIAVLMYVPRKLGGIAQWRPIQFALAVGAAMSVAIVIGAVVVAAVLLARSDRGSGDGRFVAGANVDLPLTLDGDRLGVWSLDGSAPTAITGAGSFSDVEYDNAGQLVYVDVSGSKPGFYRVEDEKPRLVVPAPGLPEFSAAASWSPDASLAAWIGPDGRLQVAAPDGGARSLRSGMAGFLWSPDSTRVITWDSGRDKSWIIDVRDGTTTASSAPAPASWSSTGELAVLRRPDNSATTVVIMHEDGSSPRTVGQIRIPPEGALAPPAFSPDGRWLAWDGATRDTNTPAGLSVADTRTGATVSPSCAPCADAEGSGPIWAPNGASVASSQDGHVVIARTGDWAGSIVANGVPVAWSPDGSRIAYTRLGADRASSTLYVRPVAGGEETSVVTLADARGLADAMAWSPDGTQIVVPLQVAESSDVETFTPSTGDIQTLPLHAPESSPSLLSPAGDAVYDVSVIRPLDGGPTIGVGPTVSDWSRDGRRLLLVGRGAGGATGLSVFDIAARATTALLDGNVQDAAWSPDERRVAFVRDQRLGVLDVGSGKVTMIAPQITAMLSPSFLGNGYLAWSPDGTRIAVGDWRAKGQAINGVADLYVVDASSGQTTRLASSDSDKRYFAFSPDGKRLAYEDLQNSVSVLDVATHNTLAKIDQGNGGQFAWAGNDAIITDTGQGIALTHIGGASELLIANTGGCQRHLIGWAQQRLVFSSLCSHQGL